MVPTSNIRDKIEGPLIFQGSQGKYFLQITFHFYLQNEDTSYNPVILPCVESILPLQ